MNSFDQIGNCQLNSQQQLMRVSTNQDQQFESTINTSRDAPGFDQLKSDYKKLTGYRAMERYEQTSQSQHIMIKSLRKSQTPAHQFDWDHEHNHEGSPPSQQAPSDRYMRNSIDDGSAVNASASVDGGTDRKSARPSIVSENIFGANAMATRIPYRSNMGKHVQSSTQMQPEDNYRLHDQKDTRNYSVGKHTPMSPNVRQSIALDKIAIMTLKARGKLLPGQPTPQQFAEILKKQRA